MYGKWNIIGSLKSTYFGEFLFKSLYNYVTLVIPFYKKITVISLIEVIWTICQTVSYVYVHNKKILILAFCWQVLQMYNKKQVYYYAEVCTIILHVAALYWSYFK